VVAALALDPSGRILAVKRAVEPAAGEWCLVCGFMEILETPEEAVLRELREEAGVNGAVKRLIAALYEPSPAYGSVIVLGYEISVEGEPKAGTDALEARFFTPHELPRLAFSSHRRMVGERVHPGPN